MGDRVQVPLELDDFDGLDTQLVNGRLEVVVESTFPRACFHCGSVDVVSHGRNRRELRDRSCGYPTMLIWLQRRYRCGDCGRTSRERHPETVGAKRVTARFHALAYGGGGQWLEFPGFGLGLTWIGAVVVGGLTPAVARILATRGHRGSSFSQT